MNRVGKITDLLLWEAAANPTHFSGSFPSRVVFFKASALSPGEWMVWVILVCFSVRTHKN